jgi:hypothetical protein
MTSEDLRSELDRHPFVPFRLHLVSGKEVDVLGTNLAFMLQNAVLLLRSPDGRQDAGYDVIALRNIERLEHLTGKLGRSKKKR